jgi:hypothetical protein
LSTYTPAAAAAAALLLLLLLLKDPSDREVKLGRDPKVLGICMTSAAQDNVSR